MPSPHRTLVILASIVVLLAVLVAPGSVRGDSPDSSGSSITSHTEHTRYLTGLQHPGPRGGRVPRTAGMESFGASTLLLQNRASRENDVDLSLKKLGDPDVHLTRLIEPRGAAVIEIESEPSVGVGFYSAIVDSGAPLDVIAYTEWYTGAAAAYETLMASDSLVLPLMLRGVHGHETLFRVVNTDHSDEPNFMTVAVYDNETGAQLTEVSTLMPPGGTLLYDSMFESTFRSLPENAGGGYIGSVHITSDKPVAVMANGDEVDGDGASAYVARPASEAAEEQYLPVVRSNYLGDSLIAVSNPSRTNEVQVNIEYRVRAQGSAEAEEMHVAQTLDLAPMGSAFVDLADRGRGVPPPRDLTDSRRDNTGFVGSAVIRANHPVLALVHEEANGRGGVRSVAAYNAFGPDDLNTAFAVPLVRNKPGEAVTQVALMNPGRIAAPVVLVYYDADGSTVGSAHREVPASGMALVPTDMTVPDGSHLEIRSDQPLAVLVNETAVLDADDWGSWRRDAVAYPAVPLDVAIPPTATPTVAASATPVTPAATATQPAAATQPATAMPEPTDDEAITIWLPTAVRRHSGS